MDALFTLIAPIRDADDYAQVLYRIARCELHRWFGEQTLLVARLNHPKSWKPEVQQETQTEVADAR